MERHVAVIGAGIAGLGTALAFARRGHRVTLLEADPAEPAPSSDQAFEGWSRPGVGQFQSTHGFVALARNRLRDGAPDVLAAVFAAGARPIDFTRLFGAGETAADDRDLVGIGCRRAVFEHVLRVAAGREPGVTIRAGARATGLSESSAGGACVVTGVRIAGGDDVRADLVVDAAGRRSPVPQWWAALAGAPPLELREECGLVYYGRYFRLRAGVEAEDGRWFFGPAGDLGYLGYAVHLADNDIFTVTLNAPAWDRDLRALRHPEVFMAAVAAIPAVAAWVRPEAVEAISEVIPMGGLYNTLRGFEAPSTQPPGGLVVLGDSRCHTNPAYGWGGSVGIAQAFRLAALVDEAGETGASLVAAFEAEQGGPSRDLFDAVSGGDRLRIAAWRGEAPPADPATAAAQDLKSVFGPASTRDGAVLRAVVRRANLLDGPFAITGDPLLRARAEALVDPLQPPPPAAGPSRPRFLAAISS